MVTKNAKFAFPSNNGYRSRGHMHRGAISKVCFREWTFSLPKRIKNSMFRFVLPFEVFAEENSSIFQSLGLFYRSQGCDFKIVHFYANHKLSLSKVSLFKRLNSGQCSQTFAFLMCIHVDRT